MAARSRTVEVGVASGAVDLPTDINGPVTATVIGANRVWYNLNSTATAAVAEDDDMAVLIPNLPKQIPYNRSMYFIAETGATKVVFEA